MEDPTSPPPAPPPPWPGHAGGPPSMPPPRPGAEPPPLPPPQLRVRHPLVFHGEVMEYFRIWIVNLALTVVTLGIYSAWATVRTRRWFYGHMRLADTPFDYSAKPIPILVGRIIAVTLLAAYTFSQQVGPGWTLAVLAVIAVLTPWAVVRSMMFRARYTAWRSLHFRFIPDYFGAYQRFLFIYVPVALSLFLAFPWAKGLQQQFIAENHRFGGLRFSFEPRTGNYYLAYLLFIVITFGMAFGLFMLVAMGGAVLEAFSDRAGGVGGEFFGYAVLALAGLAYVATYLAGWTWLRVALTNEFWNNLRLGPHRFDCRLEFFTMYWLYASNLLAIIATVGLLVPWAMVRTARYRASRFALVVDGDIDAFVAEGREREGAVGAEIGDAFQLDIGL